MLLFFVDNVKLCQVRKTLPRHPHDNDILYEMARMNSIVLVWEHIKVHSDCVQQLNEVRLL